MDTISEKHDITVLYVEDDDLIRETLADIIRDTVKTLYTAENGEEGLKIFREHRIDLVISDIKMPKMDGIEMSRQIRSQAPNVPIIITSAFNDSDFFIHAIEQKIDTFLRKPIRMERLIQEIGKYVQQIQSERLIMQEKHRTLEYLNAMNDITGLIRLDLDYTVSHVNTAVCAMLSQPCENLIGSKLEDIFPLEIIKNFRENIARHGRCNNLLTLPVNGKDTYLALAAVTIKNIESEIEEMIIFVNDMSDFYQVKEQLIENSNTDSVTGLPNFRSLVRRLESSQAEALVMVKIRKIGQINAVYGRSAGDVVLRQVAEVIKGSCSDGMEIYKLDGEKFAIIPLSPPPINECEARLSRLLEIIDAHPFVYRNIELHVSAVAVCVRNPVTELYSAAEMSMIDLKNKRTRIYCKDNYNDLFHKNECNIDAYKVLRAALDEGRLVPYFQPIVSPEDGHIFKYELLARIVDADTIYTPEYFIETAKNTTLYHRLTESMLRQGCEAYSHHRKPFSVNLSIIDINHEPTLNIVRELTTQFPEATAQMTIEITEDEGIENFEGVKAFCQEMVALGMKIAIDDFGNGYSNFAMIADLPITFIKYDGILIHSIGTTDKFDRLISKVTEYARENQIYTIAEYVDSKEVMERVHKLGIDYVQGYHISPPLPFESLQRSQPHE